MNSWRGTREGWVAIVETGETISVCMPRWWNGAEGDGGFQGYCF